MFSSPPRTRLVAATALALLATAACAPQGDEPEQSAGSADSNYPERPVELIVPFPAGGGLDVAARALVEAVNADGQLGQDLQVVNREGGGGAVGTSDVLNAEADGYTIGISPEGPIALQPIVADVPYDPEKMTPVLGVVNTSAILAVPADSPHQDLQDLVDAAKAAPGQISFGEGPLVFSVIAALIEQDADVQFNHIDYEGDAASLQALLGGNVDATMTSTPAILPQVESGDVRVLATFGEERSEFLPDVATATEQGFDVEWTSVFGIFGPAGLPDDVTEKLVESVSAATESDSFQEVAQASGLEIAVTSADELAEYMDDRRATATELAEVNGGL
jgi:putative tricarboxylic transport membrane protein